MNEPKTEQWIDDAAFNIAHEFDHPGGVVQQEIAEIIARHAPKPEDQTIRRGDVVQDASRYDFMIVDKVNDDGTLEVKSVESPEPAGILHWVNVGPIAVSDCVRIGLAKFYPDGSKVED